MTAERTYTESELTEWMRRAWLAGWDDGYYADPAAIEAGISKSPESAAAKVGGEVDRILRDHAPTSEATGEERRS